MRHDKAANLLRMAQMLASSASGLTLDELAARLDLKRRTVERMRDALRDVFPQLDWRDDEEGKRCFFLPHSAPFVLAPQPAELAELQLAVRALRRAHQPVRAERLEALLYKVSAAVRPAERRRLDVDADVLFHAEAAVVPVGPGPLSDPAMLDVIRHALQAGTKLQFRYEPRLGHRRHVTLSPLGLLAGRRTQLVGLAGRAKKPSQYRLDRIFALTPLNTPSASLPDFDMHAYAAQSFGVAHDDMEDVIIRFDRKAAPDAGNWRFHPNQIITAEVDGRVRVQFRASGMLELAWHLFSWGPNFEIIAPERLKRIMRGELVRALERHAPRSVRPAALHAFAPPGTTWESYGGGTGQP